jgi:hypothetical protein
VAAIGNVTLWEAHTLTKRDYLLLVVGRALDTREEVPRTVNVVGLTLYRGGSGMQTSKRSWRPMRLTKERSKKKLRQSYPCNIDTKTAKYCHSTLCEVFISLGKGGGDAIWAKTKKVVEKNMFI